jgi:membrane protease YdiL (CAAX protease family)
LEAGILAGSWSLASAFLLPPRTATLLGAYVSVAALVYVLSLIGFLLARRVNLKPAPLIDALIFRTASRSEIIRLLRVVPPMAVAHWCIAAIIEYMHVGNFGRNVSPRFVFVVLHLSTAIFEEALFRLCLFTLLIWLLNKVKTRGEAGLPSITVVWAANFCQALVFGAMHLDRSSLSVTTSVSFAVQILTTIPMWGGMLSGYLYRRYGIETAIVEHWLYNLLVIFFPYDWDWALIGSRLISVSR